MSHIAIVQTAPFYPPNVVMYLLFPPVLAFNLSIIFHFLLLLGFTHAYFRLFTERDEAAWLGAVAFAFCGYITLHYEATGVFNSAAWIAPFFFCLEKWIRSLRWKYCALGGLCLAMQLLAGWPQTVLLSAIYGGIYLLIAGREQPRQGKMLAGFAAMGLFSAGLGASVVLPTMEFKPYSNLAQLPYSHFASLSVAPQSFVQVLFPYLMGADWLRYHAVPYFGAEQLAVAAMYMGVLPLMLAVAALWLWRTSRAVRFAATAVVVSSLLSFGGYTPLGRVLFHIPVYNFFRDHRVHLIFLAFSVAMLAALFAGNLPRLAERTRQRLAWAIPLGFLALAAIMLIKIRAILGSMNPTIAPLDGLWIVRLHQGMRFSNPDMIIAVVTLLVSGCVFWSWTRRPNSRAIAVAAIALVCLDLWWFGGTDQPHFTPGQPTAVEEATNRAATQAARGEAFRIWSLDREHPFIRPNLNEMAGLDHIFGYSALIPGDYSDLLQTNEIGDNPWRETMANNAILSLLNTRFIFATQEQWKSLQNIFAEASPATSDAAPSGSGRENLLSPAAWIALSGSPANLDAPFACSGLPCGMKQPGLLLEKDSVYELRFELQSAAKVNPRLDVWFMNPAHWRPREMFSVSNVLIAQQPSTWVFTYVTGPQDEPVDLRFATGSSSPLRVSNISLWRAAALPRTPNPYREIAQNDGIVVLENSAAMPRARFAAKLTWVRDYIDARNRLWDADRPFDPRQETLVEGEPLRAVAVSFYWNRRSPDVLAESCDARNSLSCNVLPGARRPVPTRLAGSNRWSAHPDLPHRRCGTRSVCACRLASD